MYSRDIFSISMSGTARKATGAAWEATGALREQFFRATWEAMPTRMAEAKSEFSELRTKVMSRDVTVREVLVGAARVVELYAFYLAGRVIGSRSLST